TNKEFFADVSKIDLSKLFKDKILINENYFYTYDEIKDFNGNRVGVVIVARPILIVHSSIDKSTNLIYLAIFCLILAILINLIASFINIKKTVLEPILTLKNAIEKIKNSNTTEKITVLDNDEIGDVVKGFNEYLDSIAKGISQDKLVIDEVKDVVMRANKGMLNSTVKQSANSAPVQELVDSVNDLVMNMQKNLTILSDVLIAYGNSKFDYKVPRIEGVTGIIASLFIGIEATGNTASELLALMDSSNKKLLQ
ncbi:MAG: HAMP domain-containing protein, partial [Arcobacter sp.]|nr:HAMP domain-containing protein [Arcobacter sp.]